jgi:hypothetical protein
LETQDAPAGKTRIGEKMTSEQVKLARHALGLPNKRNMSYRNRFICNPGHDDYDNWMAMEKTGYAMRIKPSSIMSGMFFFWLTPDGAKLALHAGEKLDPEDFDEA